MLSYQQTYYKCLSTRFAEVKRRAFPVRVSQAKYEYLDVLNQNADFQDAIQDVVAHIHQKFNISCFR